MNPFGDAKSLESILSHMEEIPRNSLLYVSESVTEVNADTLCLPLHLNEEPLEEVEWFVKRNGLKQFLPLRGLGEVIENLRVQKSLFTGPELMAAVNYYWQNGTFIDAAS